MPGRPSGDQYFACLDAMRRFKPHSEYADPSAYFRAGEDCLRALPNAVAYWRSRHEEIPPSIPCRDELPGIYMRFGYWDDALRVIHSVLEAGVMDRKEFDEMTAWVLQCRDAASRAIQYVKEHPGIQQRRLYSLLPDVDREGLKWFTRYSWQIEKVKDGDTNALYVVGEVPGQPTQVPVLSQDLVDPSWGIAACVDVETTGLRPASHELLELAIVLFAFERETGKVMGIVDEYVGQREPKRGIPAEATRIHGLTRAMLKDRSLDELRIRSIADRAEFYIAHNAEFDRGFAQHLLPRKRWLCSLSLIDWARYGCKHRSLPYLLEHHRIRPQGQHRAGSDAGALLQLLSLANADGKTYLKTLLAAEHVTGRIAGRVARGYEVSAPRPRSGCAACIASMALLVGLAAYAMACILAWTGS